MSKSASPEELLKQLKEATTLKQVAVLKDLPAPDDETGLVKSYSFEGGDFKEAKASSKDSYAPTDEEMALIEGLGGTNPPSVSRWIVIRGVNPIGKGMDTDSQGDKIERSAEKDMAEQAYNTPILIDHNHDLAASMPFGMAIKGYVTSKGYREDWAIPLATYNAELREAVGDGMVNKISIGAMVKPENKICSSCLKSIYSMDCPHIPGRKDENGKPVHCSIKRVDRFLERSLCNIPARLNTAVKALQISDENIDKNLTAATIPSVNTIEDSKLAKDQEKPVETPKADETPEAVVPPTEKKEEPAAPEAVKPIEKLEEKTVETKPEAPQEVVHKAMLDEESVKSVASVVKAAQDSAEQVTKLLAALETEKSAREEATKQINKLVELQNAQLKNHQEALELIKSAAETSTTAVVEKVAAMLSETEALKKQAETQKTQEQDQTDWVAKLIQ